MYARTHQTVTQVLTVGCIDLTATLNPHLASLLPCSIPLLVGSHYGAVFPDIDNSKAMICKNTGVCGKWVAHHLQHRTWTHTGWIVIFYYALALLSNILLTGVPGIMHAIITSFLLGFAWGNMWHIIEDNFSTMGVLFWYPFGEYLDNKTNTGKHKQRKYSMFRYRTGGPFETSLYYIASAILMVLYLYLWQLLFYK